jgi:hypothetical protein
VKRARTLSASSDRGWSNDVEEMEMSKIDARGARARRHDLTVAKGAAIFSNYF